MKIDDAAVTHLRLDRSHADFGDAPRGLGAMLVALARRYDAVGFLRHGVI